MAGVKVTDLTTLGAADPADVFYIVDTSINQSRQIEVQDIYSGMPQFASGQFTPTISSVNPVATIVNPQLGYYNRVGNIVSMSFFFELQFDVLDTQVSFEFDLPIASIFTSSKDIIGTITSDDTTLIDGLYVQASGNNGGMTCNTNTAGAVFQYIRAFFQYEIK
jgi:hypothetical protein